MRLVKNKAILEGAIADKKVSVHKIPTEKIEHLVKSYSNFHFGEASCFLLAKERSWCIATDDMAAKALVVRELGSLYVITTFDILLKAVQLGVLEKSEVGPVVADMEAKADFWFNKDDYQMFVSELNRL